MDGYDVSIPIPESVQVTAAWPLLTIKGPKGEVTKSFKNPRIEVLVDGVIKIKTRTEKRNRADKMYIHTFRAHIRNMIKGVQEGFTATLKVCSGHFPITVSTEGDTVVVKNFLGEKKPRKTTAMEGVKVNVQGDQITVEGADIEKVGQTAARIEQVTRITNRDRRIFQDGCYITRKPGARE